MIEDQLPESTPIDLPKELLERLISKHGTPPQIQRPQHRILDHPLQHRRVNLQALDLHSLQALIMRQQPPHNRIILNLEPTDFKLNDLEAF